MVRAPGRRSTTPTFTVGAIALTDGAVASALGAHTLNINPTAPGMGSQMLGQRGAVILAALVLARLITGRSAAE